MKALRLLPFIALIAFASCSSNRNMAKDDTYYSPYGNTGQMATGNGSYVSPSISSNSEYDYQAYYSDSKNYTSNAEPVYQTTETVTDTNGVVYTTTETYYDADYAARIKRFGTQASSSRDYYDDYGAGTITGAIPTTAIGAGILIGLTVGPTTTHIGTTRIITTITTTTGIMAETIMAAATTASATMWPACATATAAPAR